MGTRNLIVVKHEGKYKVAQYSQWDGYPDGQGKNVLSFLLADKENLSKLKEGLNYLVDANNDTVNRLYKEECNVDLEKSGGFVSMDVVSKFNQKYPSLSRDTGAYILTMIANNRKPMYMVNAIEFAGEGLFCEWGWVIDLDLNTFEAYKGFGTQSLDVNERFYFLQEGGSNKKYYPIKLIIKWSLDKLPTTKEFIESFDRN